MLRSKLDRLSPSRMGAAIDGEGAILSSTRFDIAIFATERVAKIVRM